MIDAASGAFAAGYDGNPEQRYHLIEEVPSGGMGRVWRAFDTRMSRQVAIKRGRADVQDAEGRLRREARVGAQLYHPGIVPILDAREDETGLWLVMPWLEGGDVRGLLSDPDRALEAVADVADAMAYAHERGVIHRDLKPSNILVHQNRPVVIDWGLARFQQDTTDTLCTHSGMALGTPGFMAPEQAAGGATDARADVWALGALLVLVLTGADPEPGFWVRGGKPTLPEGPLGVLAGECLAVSPSERPADAAVVARRLRALAVAPTRSRLPLLGLVGGVVLSAVAVGVLWPSPPVPHGAEAMAELAWRDVRSGHVNAANLWSDRAAPLLTEPVRRGLQLLPRPRSALLGIDLTDCSTVDVLSTGDVFCAARGRQELRDPSSGGVRWSHTFESLESVSTEGGDVLMASNRQVVRVSPDGSQTNLGYLKTWGTLASNDGRLIAHNGSSHGVKPARGPVMFDVGSGARTNFVWNADGAYWWVAGRQELIAIDPDTGEVLRTVPHDLDEHARQLLPVDGGFIALGIRGHHAHYDWTGRLVGRPGVLPTVGLVADAALSGPWLVTNSSTSGVQLWDRHTSGLVAQLQQQAARAVGFVDDQLAVVNDRLELYALDDTPWSWHVDGLNTIGVSPDEVVVTRGGGMVRIRPLSAREAVVIPGMGTVKHAALMDGQWVGVGVGPPGTMGSRPVPYLPEPHTLRGVWPMADGWNVSLPFGGGPMVFRREEQLSGLVRPDLEFMNLTADPDRTRAGLIARSGVVLELVVRPTPALERVTKLEGARFAVPAEDELWVFDGEGGVWNRAGERAGWTVPGGLSAVSVSDEHLHLGFSTGRVEIRSLRGELQAELHPHDERVSTVVQEGDQLYTASWDGRIFRFALP